MAWELVSGMVYHGDENSYIIYQIDPTSETYTGNFWGLAGSASGTVRALAVKHEPNGTYGANTLRVIQSNWNNPVEQWDLDLTNSANATNTGMSFPNPGSLHGASYVKNGTVLALFGQTQHPCTGFAFLDDASGCGGSRLIPQGNAELGNTSFGLKVMAGPANGGSVIFAILPPRAGLPLTGGCTLDAIDFDLIGGSVSSSQTMELTLSSSMI